MRGVRPKLLLVRHGESIWNKQNMYSGWTDIPLTEKGVHEALEGGRAIRDVPIDVVFMSALIRSQVTAMLLLSVHRGGKHPIFINQHAREDARYNAVYGLTTQHNLLPVHCSTALNERHYGHLQGVTKQELASRYAKDLLKEWRFSYDKPPPGGESFEMVSRRTGPLVQDVKKYLQEKKNVLIVGHGTANRTIIMHLEKRQPTKELLEMEMKTGVPIVFEYDEDNDSFERMPDPTPKEASPAPGSKL